MSKRFAALPRLTLVAAAAVAFAGTVQADELEVLHWWTSGGEAKAAAELKKQMEGEGGGGFASIFWCGNPACETRIREEPRATCRAIPFNQNHPAGTCIVCGEPASERAFFAKSY